MSEGPRLPDYADGCIANVGPALLRREPRAWLPDAIVGAPIRVLFVIDGLGWEQLEPRRDLAPNLAAMAGGSIDSVAPSTTAAALTSISTGRPPATHGIIGYEMRVGARRLNNLRWTVEGQDARAQLEPRALQTCAIFEGAGPPVVTKYELAATGFGQASLAGVALHPYVVTSGLPLEVVELARAGHEFIYVYYDGIDRVAHRRGLSAHYEAELRAVDELVGRILDGLPGGAALVVCADHGHIEVGDELAYFDDEVAALVTQWTGEPRFRWLTARRGAAAELEQLVRERHGEQAWVASRRRVIDEGWLGPGMSEAVARRCGDVAVVARGPLTLMARRSVSPVAHAHAPKHTRHGALTSAELRVPLLHTLA